MLQVSTGRDPIFAVLDQLIAEGPPDVAEPEFTTGMTVGDCIRQAGVTISRQTVRHRLRRGFSMADAIYAPLEWERRSRGGK